MNKITIGELRARIRNFLIERDKKVDGAGVIILKKFNEGYKWLALIDEDGNYDITKGLREKGESEISCALREAFEEARILLNVDDFKWGMVSGSFGKGVSFLAVTEEEPQILPNPDTGIVEHVGYKWVSFEEMVENCIHYLKPAIKWSKTIVDGDYDFGNF